MIVLALSIEPCYGALSHHLILGFLYSSHMEQPPAWGRPVAFHVWIYYVFALNSFYGFVHGYAHVRASVLYV